MDDAAHPIFIPSEEGSGFLYEMRCPQCGGDTVTFGRVMVSQNGIVTTIDRHGDTVKEDDTSELPGALISLICDCTEGHKFVIGLLHAEIGVRVYAAKVNDESPPDPLWINPEQP